MLTFRFTGPAGRMTESEILVSGMVGKQVRFEFSQEWEGLQKTAVYRAGPVLCTSENIGQEDIIPDKVLRKALRRLYVGVCGINEDGQTVIPTIFVPGPFIHIGADGEGDGPAYDPEDPNWQDVLADLKETVRFVPQTLTDKQQAQARANIGAAGQDGFDAATVAMLLEILKKAVYTEDISEDLLALEAALAGEAEPEEPQDPVIPEDPEEPEDPQEPEEPDPVYYFISCSLSHVSAQMTSATVEQGKSCTVVLTVDKGYILDSVQVTMGGADITASAYSGSAVTIAAVTGDVVITAAAVEEAEEVTEVSVTLSLTKITATNNQRTVELGASYYTTLVSADGYYLSKVTVTMGGTDITAQAVDGERVRIETVTGAILIMAVAVEEPGPVTVSEIVRGSTSFVEGAGLQINRGSAMGYRATVMPVGQYLKKGTTYRFSLGDAPEGYFFGVQIMVASAPGLVFDSTEGSEAYHNTVISREVDTGWMQADYTYTPTEHNRIFTMNFKRDDEEVTEAHRQTLLNSVIIEEVTA